MGARSAVGAGKFGRERREAGTATGPGWGFPVRAPGMGSEPRRGGTGRVEVSAPAPRAGACPSPAAYNGVPSPGGLRGDGSVGISRPRGVSGHPCRPPPRWRQSSAWLLEPRELSSCRRGRTRCSCHVLALARVAGPSPPWPRVSVPPDPQGNRAAAQSPEPACSGGKVSGLWVCPPEMAELVGQEMNMNNGSRVYCTLQFSNRFTVYEVLCTICKVLWFTTCGTVDKVLEALRSAFPPAILLDSPN